MPVATNNVNIHVNRLCRILMQQDSDLTMVEAVAAARRLVASGITADNFWK